MIEQQPEETKQYTASEFNEAIRQTKNEWYQRGLRDGREEVK